MAERPILFSAPMVRAILEGRKTVTRRVVKLRYPWDIEETDDGSNWPWHPDYVTGGEWDGWAHCPYGAVGDRLWVKEAWRAPASLDALSGSDIAERCIAAGYRNPWAPIRFEADNVLNSPKDWREFGSTPGEATPGRYRNARFMPRWASRITLEVTAVRVERLQDITEEQAVAEGCSAEPFPGPWWQGYRDLGNGELVHQQSLGTEPPEWMIEPKLMKNLSHLDRAARDAFVCLWESINGAGSWADNPWVWVVEFRRIEYRPEPVTTEYRECPMEAGRGSHTPDRKTHVERAGAIDG